MISSTTCRCWKHPTGGPVELYGHRFSWESGTGPLGQGFRWRCSCGGVGAWQYQSEFAAYHSWTGHVGRRRRADPGS